MLRTAISLHPHILTPHSVFTKWTSSTRQRLVHARNVEQWRKYAERIDREEGLDKWRCVRVCVRITISVSEQAGA